MLAFFHVCAILIRKYFAFIYDLVLILSGCLWPFKNNRIVSFWHVEIYCIKRLTNIAVASLSDTADSLIGLIDSFTCY